MNFEQIAISALLFFCLSLFVWGKWRYDVVALMTLLGAVICGLVPPTEIFSGFGHPATITVALVLVLGHALTRAGAIETLSALVSPFQKYPFIQMLFFIILAAFLSMFLNNVGALALIMPLAISSSISAGRSPSLVLMPLSFASILGGLVTLIGTPPNIIISTYRQEITGAPFTMFDFSPVGGAIAIVGIIFLATIGWRLVTVRKKQWTKNLLEIESYLFEVKLTESSKLVGTNLDFINKNLGDISIEIISLVHKGKIYSVIPANHIFAPGDLLLVEAAQDQVDRFIIKFKLQIVSADSSRSEILHSEDTDAIEVMISPDSRLIERTVESVRFRSYYNINLLGVSREGLLKQTRLRELELRVGDVLLLHGNKDQLANAVTKLGCFPLLRRTIDFGKRRFTFLSLSIFLGAVTLAVVGIMSIQAALLLAVIAMILFKLIPVRDLYSGIEWPVLVLLGAIIPVGNALEDTGTTKLLAEFLLSITDGASVYIILTLLLVTTMTLSDILNNAATAILMAPIAKSIAETLGAHIDPFLMVVAIGASCAFLTPIGHQNNALVMGPGGYKFGDYWKLGLPLELIIVVTAIPLVTIIWPVF